jgi:hypothetical protein
MEPILKYDIINERNKSYYSLNELLGVSLFYECYQNEQVTKRYFRKRIEEHIKSAVSHQRIEKQII